MTPNLQRLIAAYDLHAGKPRSIWLIAADELDERLEEHLVAGAIRTQAYDIEYDPTREPQYPNGWGGGAGAGIEETPRDPDSCTLGCGWAAGCGGGSGTGASVFSTLDHHTCEVGVLGWGGGVAAGHGDGGELSEGVRVRSLWPLEHMGHPSGVISSGVFAFPLTNKKGGPNGQDVRSEDF